MTQSVDAVLLLDCHAEVEQLLSLTQTSDPAAALSALSAGVAANRLWSSLGPAKLAARTLPDPMLAAFGSFTDAGRARLQVLALQLKEMLRRFRYIDYPAAERAAECLAAALTEHFGSEQLSRLRFTAMPRGGLIVLGMLSYLLGLRHHQIAGPAAGVQRAAAQEESAERAAVQRAQAHPEAGCREAGAALVVVDDCALSGVRFQQFLARTTASRVIFCPLFAPPELCRAVERAEPRVQACINGVDLQDVAPELHGQRYPQWRARCSKRMGEYGYWIGYPEHIAFAWSEPETSYWNAETERFEVGWSVLPPELTLSRRRPRPPEAGGTQERAAASALCLQEDGPGPVRTADRVLWTEFDSGIAVARLAHSPLEEASSEEGTARCYRLEGTAADMWRCLLQHGTVEGAESALLERYDVKLQPLRNDLAAFVAELQNSGILTGA